MSTKSLTSSKPQPRTSWGRRCCRCRRQWSSFTHRGGGGNFVLRSSFAVFRLSHDGAGNKNHEWIRPLSSFPAGRRSRENLTTQIYYIFRETSNNTLNFGKLFYFATSQNTWVKIMEWRMTQLNCQHSTKSQKLSNGACFHSKMKTKLKLARISKKV